MVNHREAEDGFNNRAVKLLQNGSAEQNQGMCVCNSVRVCVRLRVVVSFVVLVFVFVFARLRSQMDELVRWLPKPILMLLEGGAA